MKEFEIIAIIRARIEAPEQIGAIRNLLRTLEDGRITEIHLKEVREIKEDNEEIDSDEE